MLKITSYLPLTLALLCSSCCESKQPATQETASHEIAKQKNIKIILGSTRQDRTSDKIGAALKQIADKRSEVNIEILDLRDFDLPFLNDSVPPAMRQSITDSAVKKWADKIIEGDAFIIIVPEYNAGYPGVLKNALDSLYKEWNGKRVAFIGYSGSESGGASAIAQLTQVAQALQMKPIEQNIKIPSAWKAFDDKRNLKNQSIATELNSIIDQLTQ